MCQVLENPDLTNMPRVTLFDMVRALMLSNGVWQLHAIGKEGELIPLDT